MQINFSYVAGRPVMSEDPVMRENLVAVHEDKQLKRGRII